MILRNRPLPARRSSDDGGDAVERDEDEDDRGYTWEELQADPELRRLELESSRNRENRVFLPERISRAVTTLGWGFVVVGLLLNQFGLAWVRDPSGGVSIGTLDERDFQREVAKER